MHLNVVWTRFGVGDCQAAAAATDKLHRSLVVAWSIRDCLNSFFFFQIWKVGFFFVIDWNGDLVQTTILTTDSQIASFALLSSWALSKSFYCGLCPSIAFIYYLCIGGNPWVSQPVPVPIPARPLPINPAGLPFKKRPKMSKTVKKWRRYAKFTIS